MSRTRRPPADGRRSSGDGEEGEEDASTNHRKYICHGLTATLLRRYSAALEVIPERHSSILHKAAERTWTVELFTTLPMSSLHSDIPGFSSSRLEENARTCEWKYSETHTETDFRSFSCLSWMPLCRDQKQLWPRGKDPTLQLQRQNRGAKIIIFSVISAPRPSCNAVVCYLLHDILKKNNKFNLDRMTAIMHHKLQRSFGPAGRCCPLRPEQWPCDVPPCWKWRPFCRPGSQKAERGKKNTWARLTDRRHCRSLKGLFCGTHLHFVVEPPVVGDGAHAAGPQHGCEVDGFVLDHHRRSQELHHLQLTCNNKLKEKIRRLFQK